MASKFDEDGEFLDEHTDEVADLVDRFRGRTVGGAFEALGLLGLLEDNDDYEFPEGKYRAPVVAPDYGDSGPRILRGENEGPQETTDDRRARHELVYALHMRRALRGSRR
jgi:hypothetical protein